VLIVDKIVDRLKSPVFWSAFLVYLLHQLGISELIGIDNESLNVLVEIIVTILIAIGLLNNPKNNYFVRKKNEDNI